MHIFTGFTPMWANVLWRASPKITVWGNEQKNDCCSYIFNNNNRNNNNYYVYYNKDEAIKTEEGMSAVDISPLPFIQTNYSIDEFTQIGWKFPLRVCACVWMCTQMRKKTHVKDWRREKETSQAIKLSHKSINFYCSIQPAMFALLFSFSLLPVPLLLFSKSLSLQLTLLSVSFESV